MLISFDSRNDLLEGISSEDRNSTFETTFKPTFETTFEPTFKPTFQESFGEEIYSTEDYFEFYSSSDSAQTLVPRTFSAKDSILQDFIVRFWSYIFEGLRHILKMKRK